MSHHNLDFHNKSEWYRAELAYAKQQRMIKEARRAGMKVQPISARPLLTAMAQALTRVNSLITTLSRRLRSQPRPIPVTGAAESTSNPCS